MRGKPLPSARGARARASKKKDLIGPKTGMRLWMVRLREPRRHRERKVWVTEVIALATSARGAEHVVRRELPQLFSYDPAIAVEPFTGHALKHLTYQADPMGHE